MFLHATHVLDNIRNDATCFISREEGCAKKTAFYVALEPQHCFLYQSKLVKRIL